MAERQTGPHLSLGFVNSAVVSNSVREAERFRDHAGQLHGLPQELEDPLPKKGPVKPQAGPNLCMMSQQKSV